MIFLFCFAVYVTGERGGAFNSANVVHARDLIRGETYEAVHSQDPHTRIHLVYLDVQSKALRTFVFCPAGYLKKLNDHYYLCYVHAHFSWCRTKFNINCTSLCSTRLRVQRTPRVFLPDDESAPDRHAAALRQVRRPGVTAPRHPPPI